MTVIRNFGVAGVANTIEFGKQGGTLNYDNATKVFSFALSSALKIPSGNDAQRPITGTLGMLRVNTQSIPYLEMYDGIGWQQISSGGTDTAVTQIVAGTNVTISSSEPGGTGVVTINANISAVSSLLGGQQHQIPFQKEQSSTTFSSKLLWNDGTNTLGLGGYGTTVKITGADALGTFAAANVNLTGGGASVDAAAGNLTLSGGSGIGSSQRGGSVTIQGGGGGSLGSGDIILRTSTGTTLVDRLRILRSGAWAVGSNITLTGQVGQILTSQGPNAPPIWQNPTTASGVTQILAGTGVTITPSAGTGIVTINASGGGGSGTPGGLNGQLQWNNLGSFSGTSQILYNNDSLTVGAVNSTFTITGISGGITSGASVLIKSGDQVAGGSPNRVTIAGGRSDADGVDGGSVYIDGGTGNLLRTAGGGTIYLRTTTGTTLVERIRISPTGAIGLSGSNFGTYGQVLTSQGPGLPPIWMAGGGGGGGGSGVTLVNVSGGTTGLTTEGGPITSTGTITLTGTLAIAHGGTGLRALPGETGSLFFNNDNTLAEITGMKYDGSTNLYFNTVNITTEDNFDMFGQTYSLNIKPGTARNNSAFSANVNISGGDSFSTINKAGDAIISGGINPTSDRSGNVILRTANADRLVISPTGAYGLPGTSGPDYGQAGQVLTSQGSGFPPVWQSWGGGGGTGTIGVISVTADAPLASSGGNTPNITLATVPADLGGTGYTNYTFGDMLWANSASTLDRLNIGSAGQVLAVVNGRPQWASNIAGVTAFSGGATGLTPSTATSGIVTLSGRLNIAFGGTGGGTRLQAFNNLSPTNTPGDMIYFDNASGNVRLPIGQNKSVLSVVNGIPTWTTNSLPDYEPSTVGLFLASTGTSGFWSDQVSWSQGNYDNNVPTLGRNITIKATNGSSYYGVAPGNVLIKAGDFDRNTGPAGYVTIQTGAGDSFGYFNIRNEANEYFRITRAGSWSLGPTGTNVGNRGQVLTSQGSDDHPIWTDAGSGMPEQAGNAGKYLTTNGTTASWTTLPANVSRIVAGNANIVVTPSSGTGIVTLSVVGSGFEGVTSFSGGSTGLRPTSPTTGPVVLTGTLAVTSGGTGITSYARGSILYASSTNTLTLLGVGSPGTILTASSGGIPAWSSPSAALPEQSTATRGLMLSSNGGNAFWTDQVFWSGGSQYDDRDGRSITIRATRGHTGYSGEAGGNVTIRSGDAGGSNGGGGIIDLIVGSDPFAGYLRVKNSTTEFFRINRFGAWSLGPTGTNVGNAGQVLTSQGPNSSPVWTNAAAGLPDQVGYAGYYLSTDGLTASWTLLGGGGGGGTPGGTTGQLQWNNAGAFAGTNQMFYTVPSTLVLGNASTFNIIGSTSNDGDIIPGSSILIRGGQSGATSVSPTGVAGDVTIQGGDGKPVTEIPEIGYVEGSGGNVYINGGTAPTTGGFVSIGTGKTTIERIRFMPNGSWLINGQPGSTGQAIVSSGANTSPQWTSVVTKIVAGENITITPSAGTGVVTINSDATGEPATTSTLGLVKVGIGLSITGDGTLNADFSEVVASISSGPGISVSTNTGFVTVSVSTATNSVIGGIRVGSGLSMSTTGSLSVAAATSEIIGGIRVGSGLTMSSTGTLNVVQPFELAFAATGRLGNGTIWLYTTARSFRIPVNMPGFQNNVLSPANANTTMQLYRVTPAGIINSIGFIQFNAGQSRGLVNFPNAVTFDVGDTFYTSVTTADSTLGDVSVTIPAVLN